MRARCWSPRAAGVLAVLGLLLAACGDDDDATADTTVAAATTAASGDTSSSAESSATGDANDFDPDAVLRVGFAMTQFSPDPSLQVNPQFEWIHEPVMGALLETTVDGGFEPGLAEEATIVDESTIEVVLRDGLTYHDGTPFDAESVKEGVARNLASEKAGSSYRMTEFANLDTIEVTSPTSFTIHLKEPFAGSFYPLLAGAEFFTVSPTSIEEGIDPAINPVGAGPFKFESFVPDVSYTMTKWDDYYDADNVKLAGIEFVNVAGGQAAQTALLSHAIDYSLAAPALARALQGSEVEVTLQTYPDTTDLIFLACKRHPPLDDTRVRRALWLAVDREQLNELVYDGLAEPLAGMWGNDHPLFNPELEGNEQRDVEEAKRLLADAGHPDGFKTQLLLTAEAAPEAEAVAEVLQANWKDVGVELEIVRSSNFVQDFYIENKYPMALGGGVWAGVERVSVLHGVGVIGNVCQTGTPVPEGSTLPPDEQRFAELTQRLRGLDQNTPEAKEIWQEVQVLQADNAWHIYTVLSPEGAARWPNVAGLDELNPIWSGLRVPDLAKAYITNS